MTHRAESRLFGRARELGLLDRLLAETRTGRGQVLVVRGEAGIGKSTLLDFAVDAGADLLTLRGTGIEAEAGLPFAGLHLLLRPVLGHLDRLQAGHARTLRRALGTETGRVDDRFAIGVALLELLSTLARERPVLCVIDDAHWLDDASTAALLFAARRLGSERVAMLFAVRDLHAPAWPTPGLPELTLPGLDGDACAELLEQHASDLPRHARARVLAESRGNPLALLELAATERAGRNPRTPCGTGTYGRIQHVFADRIAALPGTARTVLLVAAADGTCDTGTVLAAAERLGASLGGLRLAEEAQLLMFTDNCLGFRHPLVRAAAYHHATLGERIEAHRALAAVLDTADDTNADRRAWHLAAAATAPDETVAAALENSAEHARARGGVAAVATAYERAAELSPDPHDRGRRLTVAARAAADAGQPDRACELATRAAPLLTEPLGAAWSAMVRATLADDEDRPLDAQHALTGTAESIAERAPDLAGTLLFWAADSARQGGDTTAALRSARLAESLAVPDAEAVRDLATVAEGRVADAVPALRRLLDRTAELPATCTDQPLQLRARATVAAWPMLLGDDAAAHELALGVVQDSRLHAATGVLPEALALLAGTELRLGHHTDALARATEGLDLARETGQRRSRARLSGVLAMLAALHGDEPKAVEHAAAAEPGPGAIALSVLELGLGRHDAALDRLTALTPAPGRLEVLDAVPNLVEAAVRAGEPERARQALAEYVRWANESGQVWAQAVAARCRALLGEPELFTTAVELHLGTRGRPFERARTELLYGQWLRRERRRSRARAYLRSALAIFDRLGATPWAERARTELRATGESQGTRTGGAGLAARLTPQELRIVRLAADGLSNRDIGAKLYLSPRTVGYHLYKAYPKLGVASRAELAKLGLAS